MSLMKFLEKAWDKVEEYAPKAMDYVQKAQEQAEQKMSKKETR